MSKHGAGRAGYFVALAVAVHKMEQKSEPNMFEIVKAIRQQRPKAADTVTQYASLYMAMFYYIKVGAAGIVYLQSILKPWGGLEPIPDSFEWIFRV